jgi:putative ABC transport system permease protein
MRLNDQRLPLQMYFPLVAPKAVPAPSPPTRRRTYYPFVVTVRADDARALLPVIKSQIRALDPNQPVDTFTLVEDSWAEAFGRQRFALLLMAIFAAIALCLAAAGVFAVLSQFVAERAAEVGIRMALGATSADVVRLIVGRGLTLTAVGIGVGLGGALATSTLLTSLLYETSPRDPMSMAAAAGVLFAVASLACWLPAARAAHVDPIMALRAE